MVDFYDNPLKLIKTIQKEKCVQFYKTTFSCIAFLTPHFLKQQCQVKFKGSHFISS